MPMNDELLRREPVDKPPISQSGKPTTYLTYRMLEFMFSHRDETFTPHRLARLMAAKQYDTNLLCRQLKDMDFIIEDHPGTGKYRYNLNSTNIELQASFERFLVEVETEDLPVHLMLNYPPSYLSKGGEYYGHF